MEWWRKMRALLAFGRRDRSDRASTAAVEAATRSHERAVADRCRASAQRAEAEVWATQVRDHNTANRYDDWLRQIVQGNR